MLRFVYCFLFIFSCFVGLSQTEIKPFTSHNQGPLIHSLGLPEVEGGRIVAKGKFSLSSILNLASNSTSGLSQNEIVYFDGEMVCLDLRARYGITKRLELGVNIPFVNHSKGFMDSSIDGFHSAIGIGGGARGVTPRGEMFYAYIQNEKILINFNEPSFGISDISFELGFKLLEYKSHSMALRTYLKLNNADKKKLIGSGTVDFSCQFSGQTMGLGPRSTYFFYSLGYLRVGKGSLLEDMQIRNIGFGSLGLAIKATSLFVPKIQFDYHSKFYKNSMTQELGDYGLQLLLGADFILNEKLILTGGFSEDIKINTSPDFVLHLALNYTF